MYYPLLRTKQYELKALREFSAENNNCSSIIPILEPVKQDPNALNIAINEIQSNGMKFALILNPQLGDFKHKTVKFNLLEQNQTLIEHKDNWIPAFMYSKHNSEDILSVINTYKLNNAMLIFKTCMDIDDKVAWDIINNGAIRYVVNSFGTTVSRRLRSKLKNTGKQVIRLDDCFKAKIRNADYADEVDELFTEEPFFYKDEDNFDGYSDYTTLSSQYIEGGIMPYTLAIHLSYKKNEEQLYIHHFLSDSNENNSDIRGKFKEAAKKIKPFYAEKGIDITKAVQDIIDRVNNPDGYPGLGYLKKLSIKNHLELILSLNK